MYLQEFPNIEWLRRSALSGFAGGKDANGDVLSSKGWPNVVVKVKSSMTERDNIKGPFSLFYNLEGKSLVGLNQKWHPVSKSFYCLSNNTQPFDLHIPEGQTTTSNIHFGQALFEDVVQNMFHPTDWVLDNADNLQVPIFEVLPHTDFMEEGLRSKLLLLHEYHSQCQDNYSIDKEYEMTASILALLLSNALTKLKRMDLVSAQKISTRKELFKRVNRAADYIHSSELIDLDLESISRNCGLSKFHFIRVFSEIHRQTPSEYVSQLKVKKASTMILESDSDLSHIALELGFSELSAFTRFYKRQTGSTPSSLRSTN